MPRNNRNTVKSHRREQSRKHKWGPGVMVRTMNPRPDERTVS
jgi:hypothetical protein